MSDFKPRFTDLVSMFRKSVETNGPRPLFGVKTKGEWTWITYAEFGKMVDHFRGGLASLGLTKGDKVAVIANNRLEWAVGAYACYGLGLTYVPMYETQLPKEWEYILKDCGAKACLVSNATIAKELKAHVSNLPELKFIIDFESTAADNTSYQHLMVTGKKKPAAAITPDKKDIAAFIYTSGTTGNPKGVRLTHLSLASNVSGLQEIIPFSAEDRSLAFLPWAHVYGLNIELNGLIAIGASMALCEAVDKIVDNLGEVKPTILFAVPRIWNKIYDGVQKNVSTKPGIIQAIFRNGMSGLTKIKNGGSPTLVERISIPIARKLIFSKIVKKVGGRLKYACSGAAALSKDVGQFIDNLGITVYEGYGMTETAPLATCNSPAGCKIGSVGRPLPGAWIKIDTSIGEDGQQGEIIIGGFGVMDGYHNLKGETDEALTNDGGMRSGDMGRLDSEGYLYITGRVKELYKLENGKYVAPAPLEERITLSPYIAQVMVHGADKPYNCALIVPDMPSLKQWAAENAVNGNTAEGILKDERTKKLIREELEKYGKEFKSFERVKNFLLLPEEFTTANDMLTPTLKLKRRNVLKRYGDQLNSLWA